MTTGGPPGHLAASAFERGVAHFNAGRYFEAHEDWEELWRTLHGQDRLFVQALIQASVALHHLARGNEAGARQLARATFAKLALLPARMRGIDCEALADALSTRFDPLLRGAAGEGSARDGGLPLVALRVDSGRADPPQ